MQIKQIYVYVKQGKYTGFSVTAKTEKGEIIVGNVGASLLSEANVALSAVVDALESTQKHVSLPG